MEDQEKDSLRPSGVVIFKPVEKIRFKKPALNDEDFEIFRVFHRRTLGSLKFGCMPYSAQALYYSLIICAEKDGISYGEMAACQINMPQNEMDENLNVLEQKGYIKRLSNKLCRVYIVDWDNHVFRFQEDGPFHDLVHGQK